MVPAVVVATAVFVVVEYGKYQTNHDIIHKIIISYLSHEIFCNIFASDAVPLMNQIFFHRNGAC